MNQYLEDLLLHMYVSKPKFYPHGTPIPLNYFSPSLVLDNSGMAGDLNSEEDDFYFADTKLEDITNVDLNKLCLVSPGQDEDVKFSVARPSLMLPKELRGMPLQGRTIIKTACLFYNGEGNYFTGYNYSMKSGDRWVIVQQGENGGFKTYEDATDRITCYFATLFRMQYKWHVTFGYENCPKLKFDCTPQGAREVFRLRDLPEGKKRRTALKHWVSEHYRKKSNKNDDEYIKILDYLRGENRFIWNGLECTIEPSIYDLKRYAALANDL